MTSRPLTVTHGRAGTYARGCRCNPCRAAKSRYQATYRKRRILHGDTTVPAIGAKRRIQALQALGWTRRDIEQRLDLQPGSLAKLAYHSESVQVATHRRICAVYDALCMTPGPSSITRARARAAGWPPPLAWDDHTIDDPHGQPRGVAT